MSAFRIWHFVVPLLIQLVSYLFQRRPSWILDFVHARALNLVQVLAAVRTQAFADLAANRLQWQRQQHLLAQRVFQQQPFALVVSDLGLGVSDRQLFVAGISSNRPVQKIETALDLVYDRIKTAQFRSSVPADWN